MRKNGFCRFLNERRLFSQISRANDEITLTFLGTGSQMPTSHRGTSCIALQKGSDIWLFDCGESSQKQIQQSSVKPSQISKIFLTHLHGDHSFGIPGVLCMIGQSHENNEKNKEASLSDSKNILDIYGPEGTRAFIRTITQLTHSYVTAPHRIHEFKTLNASSATRPASFVKPVPLLRNTCGERPGSTDIYPQPDGSYRLVDEHSIANNFMKVIAVPIRHTIPCFGYVIEDEEFKDKNLKLDTLKDIVERNSEPLAKIYRVKEKVYRVIKRLNVGENFTFPDGTVIRAEDVLEDTIPSRKVVIMGDTCDGSAITPFASNPDLLVHEATLAYFPEEEEIPYPQFEKLTREKGHSTPEMAGKFAASIGTKRLLLTHFSGRYSMNHSTEVMQRIVNIAVEAGQPVLHSDAVSAAYDFLSVKVPLVKGKGQSSRSGDDESETTRSVSSCQLIKEIDDI